ncbi:MAG: hypothetical protein JO362_08040 [Streptomycetaceae bacterium]|nr:hypothetical protein [Streptomycetaceae bacterium]
MSVFLAEWSLLGYDEDPLPGDPEVLQGIVEDFTYLRDTAWSVSQGLDAVVASASSGGFEGAAADALRAVVSGRLKRFVVNVARAFSLAAEAVATYRLVLARARRTAAGVLEQAVGPAAGDGRLAGLKRQVQGQLDQVKSAAQVMEAALRDAAEMISQPVEVEGLFERIWTGVEKTLEITALGLALLSVVVDGPVGLAAFAAGAAALTMTAVDFAGHRTGWTGLLMGALGVMLPQTRGLFELESVGAGAWALLGGAARAGGRAVDVLSSPVTFRAFATRSAAGGRGAVVGAGSVAWRAVEVLPGVVRWGLTAVPGLLVKAPGGVWSVGKAASGAVGRDFASTVARYPGVVRVAGEWGLGRVAAYGMVIVTRVAGALFTPMTFHEMARFGFRGAWEVMWKRASLTGAARALGTGWTRHGARAARAGVEVPGLLHELVGFHPGSVEWAQGTAGKLSEPLLVPAGGGMPVERMSAVPGDSGVAVGARSASPAAPPPCERRVVEAATGKVSAETVAIRGRYGKRTGAYWQIDHAAGTAVRVGAVGTRYAGRFDQAEVKTSPTGQLMLTVPAGVEGDVVLFERELLDGGRTLHLDRDRSGRGYWTEFDAATGRVLRHGTRTWHYDLLTYRDTLTDSWRPFYGYEIRHYTKGLDGGLIRAEKREDGSWTWQRFDENGKAALCGTRTWTCSRIGFKDTYRDLVTSKDAIAQTYGDTWPLTTPHRSRRYLEHALVRDEPTGTWRADPVEYAAQGPPAIPKSEWRERLAGGATLKVVRISETRPPAFFWKKRTGANPFEGFFGNLFTGDSLLRPYRWTETSACGATLHGVRLLATGGSWRDIDEYGRLVRESRKLENGRIIEVGRSATDPDKWAPAPDFHRDKHQPYPYRLLWQDSKGADAVGEVSSGIRYVEGKDEWADIFTDSAGVERIARRGHGTRVREYLVAYPRRDAPATDPSGVWVEKNPWMQITGRRDRWGQMYIEAHGSPVRTTWTWTSYQPDGTVTAQGIRRQNRGSPFSSTWDDSYIDLVRTPGKADIPVRERNATDRGDTWINAVRMPDGTWTWQRISADKTVHSSGVRVYTDFAKGHWSDTIDGVEVRFRRGGRVREFTYTVPDEPTPPPAPVPAPVPEESPRPRTVTGLLAETAHHFQPATGVTVDRQVWKEFEAGKVFRERKQVDAETGRYREIAHQYRLWREYVGERLVEQRTFNGWVWRTDALSRWHTAKITEFAGLPPVGGEVGLDGHRSWRLIGREVGYLGLASEFAGICRTLRDVWVAPWMGARGGASVEMPMWLRQVRSQLFGFSSSFTLNFAGTLLATELEHHRVKTGDVEKALFNGAVAGTLTSSVDAAYGTTRLGKIKVGLASLDGGVSQNFSRKLLTDDWDTDLAARQFPARWRAATYAYFNSLALGAITGFVTNAADAALFGVDGQPRTGTDALQAGMWGTAASAFSGATTGLAQNIWHALEAGRLFARGGLCDMATAAAEATLASYLAYWAEAKSPLHITPGRPFQNPAPPALPAPGPSA